MESFIKIGVQILFALVCMFFVVYSIIAIYSLTTFGRSKSLTATMGFVYSIAVIGLVFWGLQTLTHIK